MTYLRMGSRSAALLTLLCLVLALISGCAAHTGGDTIAYLRDGVLWTIQPDGSNRLNVAGNSVVGFAWSPNHHELVYRAGASAMLAAQGRQQPSTLGAPDAPSLIVVASINGGAAIQVSPDQDASLRSDAWWDPSGHRLLYAEDLGSPAAAPEYIVSQADQPAGIARKHVANSATIPVLSPDGYTVAVVDSSGAVRLGKPEVESGVLATGALATLPQSGRPARILWQPKRQAVLYARAASSGVSLVLRDIGGSRETVVGTSAVILDYAFSPDGSRLLVQTPTALEEWNVTQPGPPIATWPESDPYALAWWAHDDQFILVQDATGIALADARSGAETSLVTYAQPAAAAQTASAVSWRPAAGSPWSSDGSQFVFVSGPGTWRGASLAASQAGSTGLYVANPTSSSSPPRLVDSGPDSMPSWSYADPSTTFLVAG